MRLLLDVHLSGRAIGHGLRAEGHDVVAADEHPSLRVRDDPALLDAATAEGRILVTCDVADFPAILRDRADERQPHAGCIILVGLDHSEFGTILRRVLATLAQRPDHGEWWDLALFVGRRHE